MDPYDSWLCGGSLVSTTQILTAAACIVDIDNLYAIAGYRKYVRGLDLDKDNCTRIKKKRVIKIRVPREHISHINQYKNTTQWMSLDIGVATVESPYDFTDLSYRIHCSYIPATIKINYDPKFERNIGTSVVALGWGRDRASKDDSDMLDRNSDTLLEVSMKIKDKQFCIDKFEGNGLSNLISKYMICTYGKGMLDGEGLIIEDIEQDKTKCIEAAKRAGNSNEAGLAMDECNDDYFEVLENGRKFRSNFNESEYEKSHKLTLTDNTYELRASSTRRQGICQNDHGGPLITWVGNSELLIGVAVNSLYDDKFECVGPYIFLSTSAAGQIVRCLLATENPRRTCMVDSMNYYMMESHATTLSQKNSQENVPVTQSQTQANTNKGTEAHTEAYSEATSVAYSERPIEVNTSIYATKYFGAPTEAYSKEPNVVYSEAYSKAPIVAYSEVYSKAHNVAYSEAVTKAPTITATMTHTRKAFARIKKSHTAPTAAPVENIIDLIFRTRGNEEITSLVHTLKPFKRKPVTPSSIEVICL